MKQPLPEKGLFGYPMGYPMDSAKDHGNGRYLQRSFR
jgi:hypothetical protein